jgi:RNA 3'-terminal phosphate cyclase (ATP)
MLTLDGALGEGGGQILRTALALSLVTGAPFRIVRLRARRARPGLRPQHLVCVQAAAAVGEALVSGAAVGAEAIDFTPRGLRPGEYRLDIGSAGSTALVAQTLLPALAVAGAPSRLVLTGGTHNPLAPPFEFLERAFLPVLRRLGLTVAARLERPGYYPRGGGTVTVEIETPGALAPLSLHERGPLLRAEATATVADLPRHIAERELAVLGRELGWGPSRLRVRSEPPGSGPGNVILVELGFAHASEVIAAFGRRGTPAEAVAAEAVAEVRACLARDVPVGTHLADQLLPYLALAGGSFTTGPPSTHTTTNADVVDRFLPGAVRLREAGGGRWRAEGRARSAGPWEGRGTGQRPVSRRAGEA